jgi:hypothetical protein
MGFNLFSSYMAGNNRTRDQGFMNVGAIVAYASKERVFCEKLGDLGCGETGVWG